MLAGLRLIRPVFVLPVGVGIRVGSGMIVLCVACRQGNPVGRRKLLCLADCEIDGLCIIVNVGGAWERGGFVASVCRRRGGAVLVCGLLIGSWCPYASFVGEG